MNSIVQSNSWAVNHLDPNFYHRPNPLVAQKSSREEVQAYQPLVLVLVLVFLSPLSPWLDLAANMQRDNSELQSNNERDFIIQVSDTLFAASLPPTQHTSKTSAVAAVSSSSRAHIQQQTGLLTPAGCQRGATD